jgi:hypothetical protein
MATAELLSRDVTTLQRWIQLACTQTSRSFCDNVLIHRSKLVQRRPAANPRWSGGTGALQPPRQPEVHG